VDFYGALLRIECASFLNLELGQKIFLVFFFQKQIRSELSDPMLGCFCVQGCMTRGGQGLPKGSLGPAMPDPYICPAGGPPVKRPYGRFRGSPPMRRAAYSRLILPWTPHAVRLCFCVTDLRVQASNEIQTQTTKIFQIIKTQMLRI
jgi:hypothetical protein